MGHAPPKARLMGHAPPRGWRSPSNEEHWLSWAEAGYLAGTTTLEEYEQAVEDALAGRPVHFDGMPVTEEHPLDELRMAEPIYETGLR